MTKITIHNMHNHTAEEVFRACLEPVFKRGTRAMDESKQICTYVGGCAAGQLLDKDEAERFDEYGSNWSWLTDEGLVPYIHRDVIGLAQSIHDNASSKLMKPPVLRAKEYCNEKGWSTDWLEQFDEDMVLE